jgi:hypothetical protein
MSTISDIVKPGFQFKNGIMNLTVLSFTETADTNLALLKCSNDKMLITVRNLMPWKDDYTWDWGHYFTNKREALKDYEVRKKDL